VRTRFVSALVGLLPPFSTFLISLNDEHKITAPRAKRPDGTLNFYACVSTIVSVSVPSDRFTRGTVLIAQNSLAIE